EIIRARPMSMNSSAALLLSLFAIGALAQTPASSDTQNLLDQIAGCIDSGKLNVDVHLQLTLRQYDHGQAFLTASAAAGVAVRATLPAIDTESAALPTDSTVN